MGASATFDVWNEIRYDLHMPDLKTPVGFLLWTVGMLVCGCVLRIGWEIGGRLWGAF